MLKYETEGLKRTNNGSWVMMKDESGDGDN